MKEYHPRDLSFDENETIEFLEACFDGTCVRLKDDDKREQDISKIAHATGIPSETISDLSKWLYTFEKDSETGEILYSHTGEPIRLSLEISMTAKSYLELATYCLGSEDFHKFNGFVKKLDTLNNKDVLSTKH